MRRLLFATLIFLFAAALALPALIGRVFSSADPLPSNGDGPDQLPISVYFPSTRQVQKLPLGQYLRGVVAAEMPAEFETEALRAQFIVARTYAVRRMKLFGRSDSGGCPLNPAADVCADSASSQAYMDLAELEQKLGPVAAGAHWKRLSQAQVETAGLVLTYQGTLIDPLYHSVSGRVTESAEAYFGKALPYLRSVEDRWGAYAPRLRETRSFTPEEISKALSAGGRRVPASTAIKILDRTDAGRVRTVSIAGVQVSGREFRERLQLRSTDFSVAAVSGKVTVQTQGYGHGVGMSQYGANGMARAGKSYDLILAHYYPKTRISRMFDN